MRQSFLGSLGFIALASLSGYPGHATATAQTAFFDALNASTSVLPAVNAGDTVYLNTLVTSETGALTQSVTFTVGAGVTDFTGRAAWAVTAGDGPRLVGFNVDLVDAATNTVIATDSFQGLLGGVAVSVLNGGLGPGTYRLVASGNAVRDALLDIELTFTGSPPATGSPSSGGVPAQGPTTSGPTAFFSALSDARTVTSTLGAGDTLYLDSLVTSATGALSQSVTFTLDSGVDGLTGLAAWMVAPGDVGPRLIGFNVDLVDAATNALIATDSFQGLLGGVAVSAFDGSLGPGTYRLVATGNAIRDASLDIALSFTGVAVAVPEPATNVLVIAALAAAMFARRRRGSQVRH